jgi:hypothetical protein
MSKEFEERLERIKLAERATELAAREHEERELQKGKDYEDGWREARPRIRGVMKTVVARLDGFEVQESDTVVSLLSRTRRGSHISYHANPSMRKVALNANLSGRSVERLLDLGDLSSETDIERDVGNLLEELCA